MCDSKTICSWIILSLVVACSPPSPDPLNNNLNKAALRQASIEQLSSQKPNIVIVFTDDQGYQDLGSYGSPKIKTPHLDAMAEEGIRFSQFYVASHVCSASRASLLTGRVGARNGTEGVYWPDSKGMSPKEVTLAEILKAKGYKTAMYGKWHLGDVKGYLPTDQGFDEYFGVPYSNDMFLGGELVFSNAVNFTQGYDLKKAKADQAFVRKHNKNWRPIMETSLRDRVPVLEGSEVVEYPANQRTLTQRYFDRALSFINNHQQSPFFIYLTPAMPHVPLFASAQFKGKSERGLYGDVIEEIDWGIGRLKKHLEQRGLARNTLIIFASDNGPWLQYKELGGSAAPFRDGKASNFEGGVRVPGIFYWPSRIPPTGESKQMVSTLDLVPTISELVSANASELTLDGVSIVKHLFDPSEKFARNIIYNNSYDSANPVAGIRVGDWKYLKAGGAHRREEHKANVEEWLFNLKDDPSETKNLVDVHPDVVKRLQAEIVNFESSL